MAAAAVASFDPAHKLFASSLPVELYLVRGKQRSKLQDGTPVELYSPGSANKLNPMLSAVVRVGEHTWRLESSSHTMRSTSDAGEPTFIFSGVMDKDPDAFFCVIFKRGSASHELEVLQQILEKLSVHHVSASVKKNASPAFALPQVEPSIINEIMRKGAEDTQMLLAKAGEAAGAAFMAAAEMHKRYAPKPSAEPVHVNPDVKDKVVKAKQAATAGAAVAKGVATGMQAATVEVGTSLVNTVAPPPKDKNGGEQGQGPLPEPLKLVGGIGMELLRDIAAVRDAMLDAAGTAWQGARAATVDVMQHQYGSEVAGVVADGAEAVEGVAGMGVAMTYAQPTQVVLTSAKETTNRMAAAGGSEASAASKGEAAQLRKQLESERAALERERAALAAERAELSCQALQQQQPAAAGGGAAQQQQQQQQRKGGWPFGFAGA